MSEYITKPLTKQDLGGFISWLKTKPTYGTYNYVDARKCLVSQFLQACGYVDTDGGPFSFSYRNPHTNERVWGNLPDLLDSIARGPNYRARYTYGSALKRAKKALQQYFN